MCIAEMGGGSENRSVAGKKNIVGKRIA